MDEVDDPNRHQWLCICRLLMFHQPLVGADAGDWLARGIPARPGWNRRRSPLKDFDTYTFIGERQEGGETRFSPPPGADVSESRPYAPLAETSIWPIAQSLATHFDGGSTLAAIERWAIAGRPALRAACNAYTTTISDELERHGDRWFRWAPRAVVEAYLRFEVPGLAAAVTLGAVLSATIHYLCEAAGEPKREPVMRAALASRFADLVYRLLRRRRECQVGAYYQLSYLALLYSLAAAAVADGLADKLDPSRREVLSRLLLNNDEKSADLLSHAFLMLPARYSTVGILKYMVGYCHRTGKTMGAAVSEHNLHPSLAVALAAAAPAFAVVARDPGRPEAATITLQAGETLEAVQTRLHGRYVAEAQRLRPVNLPGLLDGEFNPVPGRLDSVLRSMDLKQVRRVIRGWQWP